MDKISFKVDPFMEWFRCPENRTGSHKSFLALQKYIHAP